jgi:hypothetical protein
VLALHPVEEFGQGRERPALLFLGLDLISGLARFLGDFKDVL